MVLPETDRRERTPFDVSGSVLLGLGVGAALVGLNRGPVLGWSSPLVVAMFVASRCCWRRSCGSSGARSTR